MTAESIVYEEKLVSKLNAVMFIIIGAFFLYLMYYSFTQHLLGSIILTLVVLAIIGFIGANFYVMSIRILPDYLIVSFGIFKKIFEWKYIEDCREDDRHGMRYGGWGIRYARINGMPVVAYIVENKPRVVITLRDSRYREFVFSTSNPERVMTLLRRKIENMEK